MPRPEGSATVIDDAGTTAPGSGAGDAGEVHNGPEDPTNPELETPQSEPGGDTDPDGRGEVEPTGEDDPAAASDAGGEGEDPAAGTEGLTLESVQDNLLRAMDEKIRSAIPPAEEKPVEFTEEQWANQEAAWGIPRTAIKAATQQAAHVYQRLSAEFDAKLDARFAGIEKENAIQSLSRTPGFTDAGRYRKDIDEFLSHYDPKHHANAELLKRGVVYARGKNMGTTVSKVRTSQERNRKIATRARPSSPNGASRGAPVALNASERDAARKFGMSESEYADLKKQGRTISS